jgi:hypothetical protein
MRVLVATTETQGQRKNDFFNADEGELVHFGSECDGEDVDGSCGCRRCMSGLDTAKATTTFKIVEMDMTEEDLTAKLATFYHDKWHIEGSEANELAVEEVSDLNSIVATFDIGEVLEKRGNSIQSRRSKCVTV